MDVMYPLYAQAYEALPPYFHENGAVSEDTVAEYVKDLPNSIWFPHDIQTCLTISGMFIISVFILVNTLPKVDGLKGIISFYNGIMSAWSLYMLVEFCRHLFINWSKENFDLSLLLRDPEIKLNQGMQEVYLMFVFTKYVEYIDVLWMILCGKLALTPRCILQVYHHWVTPPLVYSGLYYPWTMSWIGPILNTIVHTMMYGYYCLSYFYKSKYFRSYGNYIFYTQMTQFFICLASSCWVVVLNQMSNRVAYSYVIFNYMVFVGLFYVFWLQRKKELAKRASKTA